MNPRRSFHHVRDFQSRSLDRSDTSPRSANLSARLRGVRRPDVSRRRPARGRGRCGPRRCRRAARAGDHIDGRRGGVRKERVVSGKPRGTEELHVGLSACGHGRAEPSRDRVGPLLVEVGEWCRPGRPGSRVAVSAGGAASSCPRVGARRELSRRRALRGGAGFPRARRHPRHAAGRSGRAPQESYARGGRTTSLAWKTSRRARTPT